MSIPKGHGMTRQSIFPPPITSFLSFFLPSYLFIYLFHCLFYLFLPVNICENHSRFIRCQGEQIIHVLQASYGRQNRDTCPASEEYMHDTNCHARNSHATVEAWCGYWSECRLYANNLEFGDPCVGTYKYLMVRYQCADLFVLCQDEKGPLSCPGGKKIRLLQVTYGRRDRLTFPDLNIYTNSMNCHATESPARAQEKCQDKPSCDLFAENSEFGGDPCPGT